TQWLAEFERRQREPEQIDQWTEHTVEAIVAEVEQVRGDLRPLVSEAVRQHWVAFLDRLWRADVDFELVPPAGEAAAELARRFIGLPVLLEIYQIAQENTWEFANQVIKDAPPSVDRQELLI